jgi:tRNA pseudouridine38-40 synthase
MNVPGRPPSTTGSSRLIFAAPLDGAAGESGHQAGTETGTAVRVRLDLAYDGTDFSGFAENRAVRTVGGELRKALENVLGHNVELVVAGRTDKGVHAAAQVVHFDTTARLDPQRLRRSLNKMLYPEVAVSAVAVVAPTFHARFSATGRSYRYRILNSDVGDPFAARTSWWMVHPLDIEAMNLGAAQLLGEHDFATFCRRPERADGTEASLVRRVIRAEWSRRGDMVVFDVSAQAFCHHMVRSIVGTLVECGRGRIPPLDMAEILAARDRSRCATLAPPQGLTLVRVDYEAPANTARS